MRRLSLCKSLCAILLLAGPAGVGAATFESPGASQDPDPRLTSRDLPAVLAALASQQVTRRIGDGCWVRFYEDAHFRGRSITLVGPVDMARLNVAGLTWADWESAVIGPQATVATFSKEGFRKPSATLGPGQRAPDLDEWHSAPRDQIRSVNVDCVA